VTIQYPAESIVVVDVYVYGPARRVFVSVQFHVPTKNAIELKSGLGGFGIGVVSI
jgi:hypothetical protein